MDVRCRVVALEANPPLDAARAMIKLNRAYWKFVFRMYGFRQAA